MLVPQSRLEEANALAKKAAESYKQGDPTRADTDLGPVVSHIQWERIQTLIQKGIDEGAAVLTGGTGKPEGLSTGYYVKPTIFTNVNNASTIGQEEIFGPVLVIIPYKDDAHAIELANASRYGLSGYISGEAEHCERVARLIRTGTMNVNGAKPHPSLPFGGYKQSGNGREKGPHGFEEYIEIKTISRP